jgi:preprotein translocase subunit YajC
MIIRLNTSDTVERSLTIENRNNISMGINATVSGNITEVVEITNPTFEIPANETKTIDFITKADNPGVYSGQILVTFTANMTRPVDIPSDITIIATGKPVQNFDITTVLIIILVIIVVVVLFLKKRGNKK